MRIEPAVPEPASPAPERASGPQPQRGRAASAPDVRHQRTCRSTSTRLFVHRYSHRATQRDRRCRSRIARHRSSHKPHQSLYRRSFTRSACTRYWCGSATFWCRCSGTRGRFAARLVQTGSGMNSYTFQRNTLNYMLLGTYFEEFYYQ